MKVRRLIISIIILFSLCLFSFSGFTAENNPNKEALSELLDELDYKITDADKRMIAHPNFLNDLKLLVEKYRGKLRKVFFKEDFSDGDYTNNPSWEVITGQFNITTSGRLRSSVYAQRPVEKRVAKSEKPDIFGAILQEVLQAPSEKDEQAQKSATQQASVRTDVTFSPAFEIDISIVSQSEWGSMEVVLLGGESRSPFYRMVYNASPSSNRPIQIFRERDMRSYLIDEAIKYPSLDDGIIHRIQWIRDVQGNMKVLIDGEVILSTMEIYYNEDFSGLLMNNKGGTYEWGPISILEASKE